MNFSDNTNSLFLLVLSILMFLFFSGVIFSISLRQVFVLHKARSTKRSIYKKRAIQALSTVLVLNLLFFLLSLVDLVVFRKMFALLPTEIYFLASKIPLLLGASLVFAFLWLHSLKNETVNFIGYLSSFLAILFQLKNFILLICLAFLCFYNNSAIESQIFIALKPESAFMPLILFINKTLSILQPIADKMYSFLYFTLFSFFASHTLAYAWQLQSTLFSRNKDDFGRDYYTQTLKDLAKFGLVSCVILNCIALLYVILVYTGNSILAMSFSQSTFVLLLLPLACANFLILALGKNPLRHKIAITSLTFIVLIPITFFVIFTLA